MAGVSEFISAVVGALLGSLSGGLISWLLQRSSFEREQRLRGHDKKSADRALLLQTLYAAMQAASDLEKLAKDADAAIELEKSLKSTAVPGITGFWAALQPSINLPQPITIHPEAITVFIDREEADLAMGVLDIDAIHFSAIKTWATYMESYRRFGEKVSFDFDRDGTPHFSLDKDKIGKIYPHLKELSDMANAICKSARRDATSATSLIRNLTAFIERATGTKLEVNFQNP